MEKKYAQGIFFDKPRQGAPDFVKGRMAMKRDEAVAFLNGLETNDKGYVYFDLLKSKDGSELYFTLNEWKPEKKESPQEEEGEEGDLPF